MSFANFNVFRDLAFFCDSRDFHIFKISSFRLLGSVGKSHWIYVLWLNIFVWDPLVDLIPIIFGHFPMKYEPQAKIRYQIHFSLIHKSPKQFLVTSIAPRYFWPLFVSILARFRSQLWIPIPTVRKLLFSLKSTGPNKSSLLIDSNRSNCFRSCRISKYPVLYLAHSIDWHICKTRFSFVPQCRLFEFYGMESFLLFFLTSW